MTGLEFLVANVSVTHNKSTFQQSLIHFSLRTVLVLEWSVSELPMLLGNLMCFSKCIKLFVVTALTN